MAAAEVQQAPLPAAGYPITLASRPNRWTRQPEPVTSVALEPVAQDEEDPTDPSQEALSTLKVLLPEHSDEFLREILEKGGGNAEAALQVLLADVDAAEDVELSDSGSIRKDLDSTPVDADETSDHNVTNTPVYGSCDPEAHPDNEILQPAATSESPSEIDAEIVEQLVAMEIEEETARNAVECTSGMGIEAALDFLANSNADHEGRQAEGTQVRDEPAEGADKTKVADITPAPAESSWANVAKLSTVDPNDNDANEEFPSLAEAAAKPKPPSAAAPKTGDNATGSMDDAEFAKLLASGAFGVPDDADPSAGGSGSSGSSSSSSSAPAPASSSSSTTASSSATASSSNARKTTPSHPVAKPSPEAEWTIIEAPKEATTSSFTRNLEAPAWQPLLRSGGKDLSSEKKTFFDIQTERLKAALATMPAPPVVPASSKDMHGAGKGSGKGAERRGGG